MINLSDPHVFGLPDPDPLVRGTGMDPDLAPDQDPYHQAKIVRKTLICTVFLLLLDFYLLKMM